MKKPTYSELEQQFVSLYSLKVGDKVKVIKKSKSYDSEWNNDWISTMTNLVGEEGTFIEVSAGDRGIELEFDDGLKLRFPYFTLKPTKDVIDIDGANVAIINKDHSVDVNGVNIPFDILEELYFKAGKAKFPK